MYAIAITINIIFKPKLLFIKTKYIIKNSQATPIGYKIMNAEYLNQETILISFFNNCDR